MTRRLSLILVDTGFVVLGYATDRYFRSGIQYQRQLEDLRAVAENQSVQVVAEISEKISGIRTNLERDDIQELLLLIRNHLGGVADQVDSHLSVTPLAKAEGFLSAKVQ